MENKIILYPKQNTTGPNEPRVENKRIKSVSASHSGGHGFDSRSGGLAIHARSSVVFLSHFKKIMR